MAAQRIRRAGASAPAASAASATGRDWVRVVEQPVTLAKAIKTVKNVDTIVNGHIPIGSWNDLKEYAAFTKDFVNFARAPMKAGKTVHPSRGTTRLHRCRTK